MSLKKREKQDLYNKLIQAINNNEKEIVKDLLLVSPKSVLHGTCMNSTAYFSHFTVLHQAIKNNNQEILQMILSLCKEKLNIDKGSSIVPNENHDCYGALLMACREKKYQLAQILIEYGANVEEVLGRVCFKKDLESIDFLIGKGAPVNLDYGDSFYDGVDPHFIIFLVAVEYLEVIKRLIEAGTYVNYVYSGDSLLDLAVRENNQVLVEYLKSKNAKTYDELSEICGVDEEYKVLKLTKGIFEKLKK